MLTLILNCREHVSLDAGDSMTRKNGTQCEPWLHATLPYRTGYLPRVAVVSQGHMCTISHILTYLGGDKAGSKQLSAMPTVLLRKGRLTLLN